MTVVESPDGDLRPGEHLLQDLVGIEHFLDRIRRTGSLAAVDAASADGADPYAALFDGRATLAIDPTFAHLVEHHPHLATADPTCRVCELTTRFELDPVDRLLLVAVSAPAFSAVVGERFTELDGAPFPTTDLALRLAGLDPCSPPAARRLTAGRLATHRLIRPLPGEPRRWSPTSAAIAYLLDQSPRPPTGVAATVPMPFSERGQPELDACFARPRDGSLPYLADSRCPLVESYAAWALARTGSTVVCMDLGSTDPDERHDDELLAALDAAIDTAYLYRQGLVLGPVTVPLRPTVFQAVEGAPPGLDAALWGSVEVLAQGAPRLDLVIPDPPAEAEWGQWWASVCPHLPPSDVAYLASHWRISPSRVRRANIRPDSGGTVRQLDLRLRSAASATATLGGTVVVDSSLRWDDLILDDGLMEQLKQLVCRISNRNEIRAHFADRARTATTRVMALLNGPSGTGKSLAAEVVVAESGLSMVRVNISSILNKYIGETEKSIDELLFFAEQSNAVLIIDEAEALFSARSGGSDGGSQWLDVKSAHLLARLDRFAGVCLLTSNLPKAVDKAFVRRLDYNFSFPKPSVDLQRRAWQRFLDRPDDDGLIPALLKYEFTPAESLRVAVNAHTRALARGEAQAAPADVLAAAKLSYVEAGRYARQ